MKKIEEPQRKDYFREEDDYKLFEEHDSMAQKFIKEHQIDIEHITVEDAVSLIKDIVSKKQGEPFEEWRELFLEMAAFYGRVVGKYHVCKWVITDMKIHSICELEFDSKLIPSLFVHNEIHLAWINGVEGLDSLII